MAWERGYRDSEAFMGFPAASLGADDHRGADIGPVPQKQAILEIQAQAAVRARIAKVTGPVVVVNARAVTGEVLGVQHVLQVVAARSVRVDTQCAAVHGLVLDS